MKRNTVVNIILLYLPIVIIIILGIVGFVFLERKVIKEIFYELIKDLLSTLIITMFLGFIAKIITNRLFSVEVNMKKLKDAEIQGIGTGKSSDSDILKMFGTNIPKKDILVKLNYYF